MMINPAVFRRTRAKRRRVKRKERGNESSG